MAESIIRVDSGSKERVALDLADRIAPDQYSPKLDRKAWLQLYADCLHVVSGGKPS